MTKEELTALRLCRLICFNETLHGGDPTALLRVIYQCRTGREALHWRPLLIGLRQPLPALSSEMESLLSVPKETARPLSQRPPPLFTSLHTDRVPVADAAPNPPPGVCSFVAALKSSLSYKRTFHRCEDHMSILQHLRGVRRG